MRRKLGVLAERVAANIKLGKKIAVVLGGLILLLLGVSGTSMWAIRTDQKLAETVVKRMTKARLAATLAGDTSAIAQNMGKMIMAKGTADQAVSNIVELRKNRDAAMAQFKASADDAMSNKQVTEIADLVKATDASNDNVMTWLAISNFESAVKEFDVATGTADSLHGKAEEATNWQENRVAAEQRIRNEKSRTIWLLLIAGRLIWPAAGVFGGIALRAVSPLRWPRFSPI
jgi:hypothetical protein